MEKLGINKMQNIKGGLKHDAKCLQKAAIGSLVGSIFGPLGGIAGGMTGMMLC
ncbi:MULTISPECIES: hypothetical protein [Elizabethkingia]|uniref:Bacteriocin n=2 Tax=Elizabethkingia anophelis TaxID=1117645 RepID=A0A455ZKP8_9FLAO|nr:hypothetical protein [Elizabethkingia anophelis]AIL45353.1 hypothetical protein BD94_1578 [Elizabethkingia anophelis NUHP1]DAC76581.1 TPA_exp: hypothetical protein [Elizabethkingia anophelis]